MGCKFLPRDSLSSNHSNNSNSSNSNITNLSKEEGGKWEKAEAESSRDSDVVAFNRVLKWVNSSSSHLREGVCSRKEEGEVDTFKEGDILMYPRVCRDSTLAVGMPQCSTHSVEYALRDWLRLRTGTMLCQ